MNCKICWNKNRLKRYKKFKQPLMTGAPSMKAYALNMIKEQLQQKKKELTTKIGWRKWKQNIEKLWLS